MINWPELVIGALLGVSLSLPFFFFERNERKREVGINWTKDLRSLEPLLFTEGLTYEKLYRATSAFPLDHYRRVLGPQDFKLLEDFQNAVATVQYPPPSRYQLEQAKERVRELHTELVNRGRARSAAEYSDIIRREQWTERRRHPIRWLRQVVKGYFNRRRLKKQAQKKALP